MECTYTRTIDLEWQYAWTKARAFGGNVGNKRSWCNAPHYRPENLRVVLDDDGKVAAGVTVYDMRLRYGSAILRMGGIGDVATDPPAQGRGYAGACMRDTLQYMTDDGYDLSLLYSLPANYYNRFGYRTTLVYTTLQFTARDIEIVTTPGIRTRRMRKSDRVDIDKLRCENDKECTYTRHRTEADWKWDWQRGRCGNAHVVSDPTGTIIGYVMTTLANDKLYVTECATADSEIAFSSMLQLIQRLAGEALASEINIYTPPGCPFDIWCRYRHRAIQRRRTDWCNGPMARLINVGPVFDKIAPELARRWMHAPRCVPTLPVTLECDGVTIALTPVNGILETHVGVAAGDVIGMPVEALTELVLGFRPAADILTDANIRTKPATMEFLAAVFPVASPYLPSTDKF
jgi:predicted acetyltransferase